MKKIIMLALSLIVGRSHAISIGIDLKVQNSDQKTYHEIHVRGLRVEYDNDKTQVGHFYCGDNTMKVIGRAVEKNSQAITIKAAIYVKNQQGQWQLIMQPENVICWNNSATIAISDNELTLSVHKDGE